MKIAEIKTFVVGNPPPYRGGLKDGMQSSAQKWPRQSEKED